MTGERRPLLRLLQLGRPALPSLGLALLSGVGAAVCGIGLMATAAWLLSRAAQHPPVLYLTVAVVGVRTFAIGRGVLRYSERLAGHGAALRVLGEVRAQGAAGLERSGMALPRMARSGDLVSRFVSDMDAATEVLPRAVLPYLVGAVVGAASVAFSWLLLPGAGLAVLCGLVLVCAGVPVLQAAISARAQRRAAPLTGELAAQIVELVHGAPDLLAYAAAPARLAALSETDRRLRHAAGRSSLSIGLGAALVGLAGGGCAWAALVLGSSAVRAGALNPVLLAVVVLTPLAVFDVLSGVPAAAAQLGSARHALRRVLAVIDRPAAVAEPAQPVPLPAAPYHLRVERATVRWGDATVPAVSEVELDLAPGRRVALVGPSGSGKTTVACLLARLVDPERGRVSLNGVDVRDLDVDAYRSVVALVAEDAYVFDTTMEENLRIARPDATPAQLRRALEQVRLIDFVDSLPHGLATPVGERGQRLSGGQRRRLVLARALLAEHPVLILDEPVEHLDEAMAAAITADVLAAAADRTVLLISHRPFGMDAMDTIVHCGE